MNQERYDLLLELAKELRAELDQMEYKFPEETTFEELEGVRRKATVVVHALWY